MPSLLLAALISLFLGAHARADDAVSSPPKHLTSKGRVMASGQLGGTWSNDSPSSYSGFSTWTLRANPAIAYFVHENLGVGVAASLGWSKGGMFPAGRFKTREFALGFELVWNVPLGKHWSLLLRPFVGYARQSSSVSVVETLSGAPDGPGIHAKNQLSYVRFATSLPFVYAISDGVGLGIALRPAVRAQIRNPRGQGLLRRRPRAASKHESRTARRPCGSLCFVLSGRRWTCPCGARWSVSRCG